MLQSKPTEYQKENRFYYWSFISDRCRRIMSSLNLIKQKYIVEECDKLEICLQKGAVINDNNLEKRCHSLTKTGHMSRSPHYVLLANLSLKLFIRNKIIWRLNKSLFSLGRFSTSPIIKYYWIFLKKSIMGHIYAADEMFENSSHEEFSVPTWQVLAEIYGLISN